MQFLTVSEQWVPPPLRKQPPGASMEGGAEGCRMSHLGHKGRQAVFAAGFGGRGNKCGWGKLPVAFASGIVILITFDNLLIERCDCVRLSFGAPES